MNFLRFTAGLDAQPAFPKSLPKRTPALPSAGLLVHESRFGEMYNEHGGSDDEEAVQALADVGVAGSTAARDPGGFFTETLQEPFLAHLPLR